MSEPIRWLTVDEAARYASCGKTTMYRAVRSGHLRAARPGKGRALRFLECWIDDWVDGGLCRTVGRAVCDRTATQSLDSDESTRSLSCAFGKRSVPSSTAMT